MLLANGITAIGFQSANSLLDNPDGKFPNPLSGGTDKERQCFFFGGAVGVPGALSQTKQACRNFLCRQHAAGIWRAKDGTFSATGLNVGGRGTNSEEANS